MGNYNYCDSIAAVLMQFCYLITMMMMMRRRRRNIMMMTMMLMIILYYLFKIHQNTHIIMDSHFNTLHFWFISVYYHVLHESNIRSELPWKARCKIRNSRTHTVAELKPWHGWFDPTWDDMPLGWHSDGMGLSMFVPKFVPKFLQLVGRTADANDWGVPILQICWHGGAAKKRDEIHWGCMTWEVKVDVLKSPKYSQVIRMISDNQIWYINKHIYIYYISS